MFCVVLSTLRIWLMSICSQFLIPMSRVFCIITKYKYPRHSRASGWHRNTYSSARPVFIILRNQPVPPSRWHLLTPSDSFLYFIFDWFWQKIPGLLVWSQPDQLRFIGDLKDWDRLRLTILEDNCHRVDFVSSDLNLPTGDLERERERILTEGSVRDERRIQRYVSSVRTCTSGWFSMMKPRLTWWPL